MTKEANDLDKNLCIYMSSFDGYADIWDGFFSRFNRHWSNCPYKIYLGCNEKTASYLGVEVLHAEKYPDWSSRALEHLHRIPEDYVILMLEDYYLNRMVDETLIETLYHYVQKFDLVCMRLVADPKPEVPVPGYPLIGFQALGQLNRTNTHAAIWKKSALIELITKGESLWEFEINGSVRSNRFAGGICGVWKTALPYEMAVGKGRWFRDVYQHLCRDGIKVDTGVREVEPFGDMLVRRLGGCFGNMLRAVIPLRYRQKMKRCLFPNSYKLR